MSVLRSMNIGMSGLRSNNDAMAVTSDNIANVNTVGFKRSRGVFEDVLGRAVGQDAQAGNGARLAHVQQMWSQGALVTTESPTDLAIGGDGFFVVSGEVNGAEGRFYTRAGQFHIDDEGRLVNSDDLRLQGYTAGADGTINATLGDLIMSPLTIPATPTTEVAVAANLDANSIVPPAFDPLDPGATSNYLSSTTVYDSLGEPHDVTIYYRKTGVNAWEWHAMVDGGELSGGTPGVPTEGASGTLTFTTDGELDTETLGASNWDFPGATPGQVVDFDFGTSITTDGGTGLDATTQFASPSSLNGMSQNGFAAGTISGVSITNEGVIMGVFSNGPQRVIGQVATADFTNIDGLERTGKGLWYATENSGEALIGSPGSGGRGGLVGGALEQSNVDLGTEFVNMIAYQRGFQANSKVITTSDEMYAELVNLKR